MSSRDDDRGGLLVMAIMAIMGFAGLVASGIIIYRDSRDAKEMKAAIANAEADGAIAAHAGLDSDVCPYFDDIRDSKERELRYAWKRGWLKVALNKERKPFWIGIADKKSQAVVKGSP